MMAAPVRREEQELAFDKPRVLFKAPIETHFLDPNYDVAPDGRFLMVKVAPERQPRRIEVVLNWREELERLVPPE